MKFLQISMLLAAVLAGNVSSASAVTINFNGSPNTSLSSYNEAGFNVAPNFGQFFIGNTNSCSPTCADNGSQWLMSFNSSGGSGFGDTIIIKALDNHAFTFNSFSGAEGPFDNTNPNDWAFGIKVIGVLIDNSVMFQDFTLDQINDGTGGVADFQSFTSSLSNSFVEIRFSGIAGQGHDFIIDNITLDNVVQVPEPHTIALLSLGLLGFAASRYKSTNNKNA